MSVGIRNRGAWLRFTAAAAVAALAATLTATASSSAATHSAPPIKVAMVPKLLGLPVFEANVKGAEEVAPSLGISVKYTAPATASAEGHP